MADPDTTTYKPPPLPPGATAYKPPPLPPGATAYKPPPLPSGATDNNNAGGTLGGLSAAATRGLAPVVAGAGIGATIGSVVPGVGTVFGAGAGAVAGGLTELAVPVYNALAGELGWPKSLTPQEMTDKVLDHFGVRRPQGTVERIVEATAGAVGTTAGVARGAGELATRVAGPVTKRVFEEMAKKPVAQSVAAATGGAAGQTAREAGAGPLTSTLIGMGTSALTPTSPFTFSGRPSAAALAAHDAGYVLHPGEISERPGPVSQTLAGVSGKIKTQQQASLKNQEVTNNLAARDLGLREGTPLTDDVFEQVRQRAGQAYRDIAQAVPFISTRQENSASLAARQANTVVSPLTPQIEVPLEDGFARDIDAIGSDTSPEMRRTFPQTTQVPAKVAAIQTELRRMPTAFSPEIGLEYVKIHRHDAQVLFRSRDDPEKLALARAHMRAADAIEDLMDRQLANIGDPTLVANYERARQLIAKSYDVQTSMSGTDVNARRIAALNAMNRAGTRRRELTGGLKSIADAYINFPKNLALLRGPHEEVSVLDVFGAGAGIISGHPVAALWPVARPSTRHLILSGPYQRGQIRAGDAPLSFAWPVGVVGAQGQEPSLYPYLNRDAGYDAILRGTQ